MELRNINTCINCENLIRGFVCQKHNQKVEITNFCESHSYKESITENSSCSNCSHFELSTCSNPEEASNAMICFDWQKKN